ncbi:43127_t:CDS:1, partial [Gigaspora margarita]
MTNEQTKQITNLHKEVFIATKVDQAIIVHVVAEFNKTRSITLSEQ